ncbi:hypothetical protein ACFFX0_12560 [Citricoccus parietis]|uniref:Uncharacterized protein n=1 Tax=Citricoccus parietis TaxID=592307 RepID=A0ABV5FZ93_9MICC
MAGTAVAGQLTLQCRQISGRGEILHVPGLLGCFCLLTAAPHERDPLCCPSPCCQPLGRAGPEYALIMMVRGH